LFSRTLRLNEDIWAVASAYGLPTKVITQPHGTEFTNPSSSSQREVFGFLEITTPIANLEFTSRGGGINVMLFKFVNGEVETQKITADATIDVSSYNYVIWYSINYAPDVRYYTS